jgi:hypothetical protein
MALALFFILINAPALKELDFAAISLIKVISKAYFRFAIRITSQNIS